MRGQRDFGTRPAHFALSSPLFHRPLYRFPCEMKLQYLNNRDCGSRVVREWVCLRDGEGIIFPDEEQACSGLWSSNGGSLHPPLLKASGLKTVQMKCLRALEVRGLTGI